MPGKHNQLSHAGSREIGSEEEGKKFIAEQYGGWKQGLSKDQSAAMDFYQSPGYQLMNGQLRGQTVNAPKADLDRAAKASKDLQAAIDKAPPLKEAMTVWRGFSADQFAGGLKEGSIIHDKGFTSTSIHRAGAGSFSGRGRQAMARIWLPSGTRAAGGSVKELVLSSGSKFRVMRVTREGRNSIVYMELVD